MMTEKYNPDLVVACGLEADRIVRERGEILGVRYNFHESSAIVDYLDPAGNRTHSTLEVIYLGVSFVVIVNSWTIGVNA